LAAWFTTFAAAVAGGLAQKLRRHPVYVQPEGDGVTVAPVGAGDDIAFV